MAWIRFDEWRPMAHLGTEDYNRWRQFKGLILPSQKYIGDSHPRHPRFDGTITTTNILFSIQYENFRITDLVDLKDGFKGVVEQGPVIEVLNLYFKKFF